MMTKLHVPFLVLLSVSFSAGCISSDIGDATSCCLCLLETQTDGTTMTVMADDTILDGNCVAGAAAFEDENPTCSEPAASQIVGQGQERDIPIEAASCRSACESECTGFTMTVTTVDNTDGGTGDGGS